MGGEIFRTCPDRPWGPLSLLYNGYRVFPGGKRRPGRDADPSSPSAVGHERVELYLYSPYGPYGLYRASVELYSTPPMGRTACTEPQCLCKGALYLTVELYSTPPMGRTACTEPQCLCKGALYLYLL